MVSESSIVRSLFFLPTDVVFAAGFFVVRGLQAFRLLMLDPLGVSVGEMNDRLADDDLLFLRES